MKKLCDLHTHSIYSDGTFSPTELVDSAIASGLSAIALCDHNTVAGISEFMSASENKKIETIAGAEFSVDYNDTELHLLGLFIPEKSLSMISELMKDVNKRKEQSNIELVNSLNNAGYDINYDYLKKSTPNGIFNRAHVASLLTEKGYTKSISEAFETLLSKSGEHYREPARTDIWDMISFLSELDATPVLAHPFLNLNESQLDIFLPLAKEKGLIGMECYYSTYDNATTEKSLRLADKFNLKPSGGSDFHGDRKPDIMLGKGKGNLEIPYCWVNNLKDKVCKKSS